MRVTATASSRCARIYSRTASSRRAPSSPSRPSRAPASTSRSRASPWCKASPGSRDTPGHAVSLDALTGKRPLRDGDGVAGRARGPLHAQRGKDVHELVDPIAEQLGEVEILVVVDAVLGDQLVVHGEG